MIAAPLNRDLPRISVITPSFNQCEYIEQTLRSILSQKYPNLEYIVIDGGSTDGSQSVIRQYENQLAYWCSERDGGQADAINKGFRRATGDILCWVNSDDMLLPRSLMRVAQHFVAHPNENVVCGFRRVLAEGTRQQWTWRAHPEPTEHSLRRSCYIAQETVFLRRRVWETVGELDTTYYYTLDYDWWQRFLNHGFHFTMLPYFLGVFRMQPASKTAVSLGRREQELSRIYAGYLNSLKTEGEFAGELGEWGEHFSLLLGLGREAPWLGQDAMVSWLSRSADRCRLMLRVVRMVAFARHRLNSVASRVLCPR